MTSKHVESQREPEEARHDYEKIFKQTVGRAPTRGDADRVSRKIPFRLQATDATGTNGIEFNDKVAAIRTASYASDTEVKEAFEEIAREEREKDEKRRAIKRKLGTFAKWSSIALVGLASLGGAIGSLLGTSDYFSRQKIQQIEQTYQQKEKAFEEESRNLEQKYAQRERYLEERFFGPLESLTTLSNSSSLPQTERELITLARLGREFTENVFDEGTIFYDKPINDLGGRVTAKIVNSQEGDTTKPYVLLVKKDSLGGIAEAYLYDSQGRRNPLEAITNSIPTRTIIFSGDNIKVIDYKTGEVKQVTRENTVVFRSGEGKEIYQKNAEDVMREFRQLYSRGPIANPTNPSESTN